MTNDDLISRKELLSRTIYNPLHAPYITKQDVEDMPSAQPEKSTTAEKSQLAEEKSTRDLISRQDAIDAIGYGSIHTLTREEREDLIRQLPSAQPAIASWLKQLQEQIASEPESISKSARLSLVMYIIDEVNTI